MEHEEYMRRALELASRGDGYVSPNPMVGAVIVAPDGRIIGEGYHRRWGEAHAEVNAVNSVSPVDQGLIPKSTIYVTLEPCSHYGKTPPCAELLIRSGFHRVVVGAVDPFEKVAGRGIRMLTDAGIEVVSGVMAEESRRLNCRFFTAHTLQRPYVLLKWAGSRDGFMDVKRGEGNMPARFSTPVGQVMVHKLRSQYDAILAGPGTLVADNPSLDNRLWWGRSPRAVILNPHGSLPPDLKVLGRDDNIIYNESTGIEDMLSDLYRCGITSLMVEGGAKTLNRFIDSGIWDLARVEVAPWDLAERGCVSSPSIPSGYLSSSCALVSNRVDIYSNNPLKLNYI